MNGVRVHAAIERDSGLCLQVVPDRTVDTGANYPAMVSPWHPHYIGWLGCVQEPGTAEGGVYLHDVVVHQQNFVDPPHPELHTQNCENLWMC